MRTNHQRSNTLKPKLLAASIIVALCSSNALAADPSEELDMVVVVGQATAGLDTLVTSEDLEKIQANDLSDVFRGSPEISVGGPVGMGQKLYVRNVGEDMLNITVDGAEQAGAVFHHAGRIAIEPELIKQVEVEAGAGSATAGPGALGGSVRFTTKDPKDLLNPGENAGALIKATYFDNGSGPKTSATVFGQDNNGTFSALASFVTSDLDNVDDGNGDEILGTEIQRDLGYAKLVADFDQHYFSLSYMDLEEEGELPYKPEWVAGPRNAVEPTEGNRETTIANYRFDPSNIDTIDLSVNVYQTKLEQMREYAGTGYNGHVETIGATIKNKSKISNHQLIYGVNFRDDESLLNDVDTEPFQFTEEGTVTSVFVQDIIEVTDKLTTTAGVRYDKYELTDISDQDIKDSGVSTNLSANYAVSDKVNVSAGYGEALRGAEVKDSFKLSSSTNSADLEAEKAKNLEVGMDYTNSNFKLAVGAYKSIIEDAIGGTVPWSREYVNMDDEIRTLGFYAKVNYSFESLTVSAAAHSSDTEMDDIPVTRYQYSSTGASTGDSLILDVNYQINDALLAGWTSQFVKGIHDIELDLEGEMPTTDKPGYSVHDAYLTWLPMKDDTLKVGLTVKNIFNKQYLNHGSVEDYTHNEYYEAIVGSPEAGRDIRLSIAARL